MNIKIGFLIAIFLIAFTSLNAQESSTNKDSDTTLLGLPGDNLDLYAVLDLFQKSKTIEEFEKSLNDKETGINNLDLDLDEKVDFIKIDTKQEKDDFVFVLQVDVLKGEIQDVAAILVSKGEDKKVTLQIVGDEELYGKDYVIEPKSGTPAVTANPAYIGTDTVVVSQPATVVIIESEPIIQYVYSPVYVPYYPPYYYGYYPPYYHPYPVVSFHVYFGRNSYHHHHYHGGHHHHGGNTVIVHNHNSYNNYNRSRHTSNTVHHNKNNGNYRSNKQPSQRPSTQPSKRPQSKPAQRPKNKKQPSHKPNTHQAKPAPKQHQPSTRQATPQHRTQPQQRSARPQKSGGRRR
ncbi:MAG: hypothetical protein KAG84_08710 [Bacteroidales bacterium]|nr:hypothetical protein [Bacteroidales bacterium]